MAVEGKGRLGILSSLLTRAPQYTHPWWILGNVGRRGKRVVASGPFPPTPLGTHLSHGRPVGAFFSCFGKTCRCAGLWGWRRRVPLMRHGVLEMGGKPERPAWDLSPEVPLSLSPFTGAGWVATGLEMLVLPPTRGRGPWPGASSGSMVFDWVQGPYRVHRAAVAADVLRRWRCPYTCLCLYDQPGVSKVYRKEVESARNKKEQPVSSTWVNPFLRRPPSSFLV